MPIPRNHPLMEKENRCWRPTCATVARKYPKTGVHQILLPEVPGHYSSKGKQEYISGIFRLSSAWRLPTPSVRLLHGRDNSKSSTPVFGYFFSWDQHRIKVHQEKEQTRLYLYEYRTRVQICLIRAESVHFIPIGGQKVLYRRQKHWRRAQDYVSPRGWALH